MDHSYLLLCVIWHISSSHTYVEIFHYSTNWFEANNYCSFTGGRLANPDDMNQNSCTNKSMDIWLGKYDQERLTPWIAKLGCYLITDRGKLYATPSLLDCYRSCQSTSFGYKKPWCSCEEDAIVDNAPDAACVFEIRNFLWIYNNTEVALRDDEYTMGCITAKCTGNGTIFRAVNCSSHKFVSCQTQGSSIFSTGKDSQDNGEKICNENSDHLITKQMCSSFDMDDRITPEIWTGIQRFRYNTTYQTGNRRTDKSTGISNCVYVRCPSESGLKLVEYIENCERQLDGFVCTFHGHSENYITVKPSPESSLALAVIRSYEPSYLSFGYESTNVPLQSIAVTSLFTKTSVSLYAQQKTASSILPTSVTLQLISDHARIHVVSASVDTSAESAVTNTIDMSNIVYSSVVTEQNIKQVTDNNGFIVYVSVPVIVVVILVFLGIFGFYRLWRRKALQENTVYNDIHMTINNDPDDQYTDLDLQKKNSSIENDYENEVHVSSDDHVQYMNV